MLLLIAVFLFFLFSYEPNTGADTLLSNTTDVEVFEKWVRKIARIAPVRITDFAGMDRGLVAEVDIEQNSTLIDIDLDDVIYPQTVLSTLSDKDRELFLQMDDDLILTAFLIQERIKGDVSRWYPWIQTLPKHPVIPSSFSPSEIAAFEDPAIIRRLHMQRHDYFSTYFSFSRHMCHYFLHLNTSFRARLWACSYAAYEWGYTIVITRAVTSHRFVIPLMDYRNFITTDSPFESVDRSHELTHVLDLKNHRLRVFTDKRIKQGRQVYLNYESLPSHYYLAHFGFVPISNIHDCLLVPLPDSLSSSSSLSSLNSSISPLLREVLNALGFPSDDSMCLDVTRFMNDKALAFFLLRNASTTHLQHCLSIYQKVMKRQKGRWESTDVYQCAVGVRDDNAKEKWDELKGELKHKLYLHLKSIEESYSTSIAADNFKLHTERNHMSTAAKLALKWRVSRKHLLQLLLNNLQIEAIDPEQSSSPPTLNEPLLGLNDWIKQHSSVSKLSVGSTPWGGFGIIAKEAIRQGEEVLVINEDGVIDVNTALKHPKFGKVFSSLYNNGTSSELLIMLTLLWEKYDNERWSPFAPLLTQLPSIDDFDHPVLLSSDEVLQLYGSSVLDEVTALNITLQTLFSNCCNIIQSSALLRSIFTPSFFTYSRFLWGMLLIKKKSVIVEGEPVLIPPLMFAQSSIYQEMDEYPLIRKENETFVVVSSDSTQFTTDWMIRQGYPNWYMLLNKGELLLAMKRDCILWNLELLSDDPLFDIKLQKLNERGYDAYERFCLLPDAELVPNDFFVILSILKEREGENRWDVLQDAIREKMGEYITLSVSDRTRSRRGQYSNRLMTMNRFISSEKRLLRELRKSVYHLQHSSVQ